MNRFNQSLMNYSSLITVVCFLIALILGGAVLFPKFQELRVLGKNIEEKRAELQSTEEYVAELRKIEADLAQYQDELSNINFALPDNPSIPSLFNFIQMTTAQSGLVLGDIGAFSVALPKESATLRQIIFDITVTGSYSSFKNFLSALEKTARLIEIEGISFSQEESGLTEVEGKEKTKESFTFNLRLRANSY